MIVVVADVFEKFLEQEKARLLEQAQLDEENEAKNLVSRVKVCKKNDDTSAWFTSLFLTCSIALKLNLTHQVERTSSPWRTIFTILIKASCLLLFRFFGSFSRALPCCSALYSAFWCVYIYVLLLPGRRERPQQSVERQEAAFRCGGVFDGRPLELANVRRRLCAELLLALQPPLLSLRRRHLGLDTRQQS